VSDLDQWEAVSGVSIKVLDDCRQDYVGQALDCRVGPAWCWAFSRPMAWIWRVYHLGLAPEELSSAGLDA